MIPQKDRIEAAIRHIKTSVDIDPWAMERSSQYYHGGWIPCQERLPEEHIGFYLVTVQKRRITALNVIGYDDTVYDIDTARWDYDRRAPQRGYHWCKADKVIAWMPLPGPYRQKEEP